MPSPAQIAAALKAAEKVAAAAAKKVLEAAKAKKAIEDLPKPKTKVATQSRQAAIKAAADDVKEAKTAVEVAKKSAVTPKVPSKETPKVPSKSVAKVPSKEIAKVPSKAVARVTPQNADRAYDEKLALAKTTPKVVAPVVPKPAVENLPFKPATAVPPVLMPQPNDSPKDVPPVDEEEPATSSRPPTIPTPADDGGSDNGPSNGGGSDTPDTPDAPVGDAPDVPTVDTPAVPQAPANAFEDDGRTLAFDTFKNTLALFFGREEIEKGGWVQGIYKSVSGFYKSGSTVTESLNLSLQDVRTNPDLKNFTKRFSGIYSLQDRLVAGEAIDVPTVAEYFKAESDMGNVLRDAGMGDLATQDFLGNIIGKGKSVLEIGNLISGAFSAIDNAPQALKDTLQKYYPGADRSSIAKAMLMGVDGAAELDKKIKGISVLSAAGSQGVTVGLDTASDIAARGYNYQDALQGFGQVKELGRATGLANIDGDTFTQTDAQKYVFEQDVMQKQKLQSLKSKEEGRFSGSSGVARNSLTSGGNY